MAFANFFDKTAMAALQVLQGLDHASFIASLESQVVGVAFDDSAVSSPEGRVTLDLTANLLARLYPQLAFIPHGSQAKKYVADLMALTRSINPVIDSEAMANKAGVILAVGITSVQSNAPVIYMGSDGWITKISSHGPVGSGFSTNPFGASAAACFGTANVFRVLFGDYLVVGKTDENFTLSLLDYDPRSEAPTNLPLKAVNIGESYLVGLGAVGNSAVWALGRIPELSGAIHLIDHETIELSNLQRYVLAFQDDIGKYKSELSAKELRNTEIDLRQHPKKWGEYLREADRWQLERVAVAVDSSEDRQAVQAALPKWIFNAWTQSEDLGVSRHHFVGDGACLMCLYMPSEVSKHLDMIIAEAIGLPQAVLEVRQLLHANGPIGRDLLSRAAAAMEVPIVDLQSFENEPVRSFYNRAICGGVVLRLGGKIGGASKHQMASVPLAFQSALAGIMLAAELVAHAGGLRAAAFPTTTKIDLLRPLGSHLSLHIKKHRSGFCICQDADYINAYREKYDAS